MKAFKNSKRSDQIIFQEMITKYTKGYNILEKKFKIRINIYTSKN